MDQRGLLTLESAVTAIEEAASAVAREVERDRLREASLARLSTVEAELNRSRLALEKIIREEAPRVPLFNLADIFGSARNLIWKKRPDEKVLAWDMKIK